MKGFDSKTVKKWLEENKEFVLKFFLAIPIFILGTWRLSEIQQPVIYSDEYGYWSNSAFLMGDDWSSVTSHIGYYSYGYSLILMIVRLFRLWFGLGWDQLYRLAIVFNALMLVASYFLANKITRRYWGSMHPVLSNIVCTVVFLYSSNIFYAHMTLTETAILCFFWVFLYLAMKAADAPNMVNHALIGVTAVYIYTIHQRTVAILITALVLIVLLKLLGISKIKDTLAFFISVFVTLQLHSMIKLKLQNDSYLGLEPIPWGKAFAQSFSLKTLVLVGGILLLLVMFYLAEKGKARIAAVVTVLLIAGAVIYIMKSGILRSIIETTQDTKIAINDFSGQWGKLAGLLTVEGALRLAVSIIGKWFYMASATGLIVCWGIKSLLARGICIIAELAYAAYCILLGKENKRTFMQDTQTKKESIWFFGVFLAFLGTFLICAIYKEGFYKNDDLVNGRYNEFLMGILLIYSFYALLKDKHWVRNAVIFLVLYLLSGAFCQYLFDEMKRTEFELCHSAMLGRIIWNYSVPYGAIRRLCSYVLPLGIGFLLVMKLGGVMKNQKLQFARLLAALLIPAAAWTTLAGSLLEHYNVSINQKYNGVVSSAAYWIDAFDTAKSHQVYFFADTKYERFAQQLQYILQDRPVIQTTSAENNMEEDAFYVTGKEFAYSEQVQEQYLVLAETNSVAVLINKDKELAQKWYRYIGEG